MLRKAAAKEIVSRQAHKMSLHSCLLDLPPMSQDARRGEFHHGHATPAKDGRRMPRAAWALGFLTPLLADTPDGKRVVHLLDAHPGAARGRGPHQHQGRAFNLLVSLTPGARRANTHRKTLALDQIGTGENIDSRLFPFQHWKRLSKNVSTREAPHTLGKTALFTRENNNHEQFREQWEPYNCQNNCQLLLTPRWKTR
jgi:hypothetical protein